MNKERFDELFEQGFEIAAREHTVAPDPSNSWRKVQKELQRREKRVQRLKMLPYVAASFILGAAIFGSPTASNAFHPFFQTMKNIQSDVVSIIFGSKDSDKSKAKTSPPDGQQSSGADVKSGTNSAKEYGNWNEAAPFLAFPPVAPEYIPSGYEMGSIRLIFNGGQERATEAVMSYSNGIQKFRVAIRQLDSNETLTSVTHKDAGEVEKVIINNVDAYLVLSGDKRSSIEYLLSNLYVSISGDLTREQIIQIAKNTKWSKGM